ncbi:MAG: hypothetical protein NZM00_04500 [Anaerolinea sp.]|nr:hypothetical protein [Anaerolinea sp.]
MVTSIFTGLLAVLGLLLALGWVGLRVRARAFPSLVPEPVLRRLPLPVGLPPPVERFARVIYGDTLPEVRSAVISGRARLAPTGLPLPTRFRFYYDAARSSHYHEIQATWFTLPFLHIHERNLEGHVTLDLSILGRVEDASKTNRAGIQGYWAETLAWLPAIPLSDPRVRWEAVDAITARLFLPGLDEQEAFTVRFDAATGLMTEIETLRYQSETQAERWRWFNRVLEWGTVDGQRVPIRSQTQWNDSTPWATWEVEQIALNVDVTPRLAQFGGNIS